MVKMKEADINFSGADIVKVAKDMFKTDKPTVEQIQYVIPMLRPTNYLLEHHTVKGHPVTYSIPNYGNHNQMKYFSHRPWQRAILNDQAQSKVIIKSRQLGFSEVGISEALWFCDTHSYDSVNALYTFPTNKQMKDFVKSRINPEFQEGYYAGIIDKYNDSLDQKSIRNSRILFRSSSKGSSMEGVDIDLLSLDEYDRLNPTAEISALESLSSSKYGLVRRWSTPTIPDYGIHKLYKESDQRKWVYKCPHCGLVQQMNYEKNIKLINPDGIDLIGKVIQDGTYQFVCQRCGKPLDRWYSGFWDITAPKAGRTHGYAISQMDAVWVTPDALKQKELRAPNKQFFYNYTLGMPYEDSTNRFYQNDVLDHRDDRPKVETRGDYRLISAGIDWGEHYHHVVVLGMTTSGRVDLLTLKRFERSQGVEHLEEDLQRIILELDKFKPNIIIPDIGFNGNYVDKLTQHFGKQVVYGCIVKSAKSNGDPIAHFNETSSRVTIDKLTQNVMMMADMKRGDIHFYNNVDQDLKLFISHWMNVVIRTDEDEDTQELVKVIKRKGDDHYAQSSVYAKVGMNKLIDVLREERETPSIVTALDSDVGAVLNQEPTDLASEFDIM